MQFSSLRPQTCTTVTVKCNSCSNNLFIDVCEHQLCWLFSRFYVDILCAGLAVGMIVSVIAWHLFNVALAAQILNFSIM